MNFSPERYLLLAALTATFGFIVWFRLATSIRLPGSFQIQYDINRPYVLRILARRWIGFAMYGLIPFLLITWGKVLGTATLADLGIFLTWNAKGAFWLAILLPVAFIYLWSISGKTFNLVEYPEMRIRVWTPQLYFSSALSWIVYLAGVEFLFRGMLLQSLRLLVSPDWMAILITTGIYGMIHYFKRNIVSSVVAPVSLMLCYITLESDSLLPAIIFQVFYNLVHEWLSILRHPEIRSGVRPNLKVRRTLDLDPSLQKISVSGYTWFNATYNVKATPTRVFYPRTREDLVSIIRHAESRGLRVKVIGSGHSFSEAAKSEDYMVDIKRLCQVRRTDPSALRDDARETPLVTADAGVILKVLNKKLDKMGLALINMGAVDMQTVSGALMTGTHGSGIHKPAFPDMVRSLRMVGTCGRLMQIEPKDGITDPKKHNDPKVKLIQDDDVFYSAVLSFGAMGIVYELVLEVTAAFRIEETRSLQSWSKLKEELLAGTFMDMVKQLDFASFRVNPHQIKNDHLVSVVKQKITTAKTPSGFNTRFRNLLAQIGGNSEFLLEIMLQSLRSKPQRSAKRVEMALKATKDRSYWNKSYKVLFQSGMSVVRHGISAEFAFKATPKKIVKVLEAVFEITKKNTELGSLYQSSFVSVRFVKESNVYLAPTYGKAMAYFDLPLLYGTYGDLEILRRFQEEMIRLGGIPHWGKINNELYQRHEYIRGKYDKLDTWMKVREDLDPKGTFLNVFVLQMGLAAPKTLRHLKETSHDVHSMVPCKAEDEGAAGVV